MVFASHLPWYQYFPNGIVRNAPEWLSPAAPLFGAGGFAVVIFLVISGAVLCRLVVLKAQPFVGYVCDRLGKLFPIFWVIAAPVLIVALATRWLPVSQLPNAAVMVLGLGFVTPASWAAIFPSWWYMGIAWQVVVVVPLMVWGLRRVRPAGVLAVTAIVVTASCWVVPWLGLYYAEKSLVVCRGLEVLGGAFIALEIWPEVREKLGVSRREAALLVAATIACLVALLAFGLGGRWLYRAAGLALTAIVAYGRVIERSGIGRLARFAVYLGGLSFAVYLLHEPVMILIRRLTGAPAGISIGALAALSLVVVAALAVLCTRGTAWLANARRRRLVPGGERP
jgi:peptidoglycan/LPS O-acetylase OafA/YrhL